MTYSPKISQDYGNNTHAQSGVTVIGDKPEGTLINLLPQKTTMKTTMGGHLLN